MSGIPKVSVDELKALVEERIATCPVPHFGHEWAAEPREWYADKLGVSVDAVDTVAGKPPFDRRTRKVNGNRTYLLRVGERIQDTRDWQAILMKEWENWQANPPASAFVGPLKIDGEGNLVEPMPVLPEDMTAEALKKKRPVPVTPQERMCLWGLANDLPGPLALHLFRYALKNWTFVAASMKLAAHQRTKYIPRFWGFPSVTAFRSFYRAALHAYVTDIQSGDLTPPLGIEALADPEVSAMVLTLTDPNETLEKEDEKKREAELRGLVELL